MLAGLRELPQVQDYSLRSVDLGSGSVICAIVFPEALFYEILSARAGMPIRSDAQLLQLLTELSQIKQEYDKISDALSAVRATGYGVVMPAAEEMKLETPEIIRKGGAYGVKLKAGAPSIHMVRVDIDTEINPMVGDEKQSQDLVNSLMGEDPEKLWQSNIFGKSVYDLIQEGLRQLSHGEGGGQGTPPHGGAREQHGAGADHEAAGNAGGSQGQVPGNTDKNRQRGRDGADLFDSVGENSFLDILSLQR